MKKKASHLSVPKVGTTSKFSIIFDEMKKIYSLFGNLDERISKENASSKRNLKQILVKER